MSHRTMKSFLSMWSKLSTYLDPSSAQPNTLFVAICPGTMRSLDLEAYDT